MNAIKTIAFTIIGLAIFVSFLGRGSTTGTTPAFSGAPAPSAAPVLRSAGWRCYTEATFEKLEGQVTNISDKPISNVEAVEVFKTGSDQFVKSADAMLTYNPIMPGQTSPFLVITTGNPMISNCSVSFTTLFGGTLATD